MDEIREAIEILSDPKKNRFYYHGKDREDITKTALSALKTIKWISNTWDINRALTSSKVQAKFAEFQKKD